MENKKKEKTGELFFDPAEMCISTKSQPGAVCGVIIVSFALDTSQGAELEIPDIYLSKYLQARLKQSEKKQPEKSLKDRLGLN